MKRFKVPNFNLAETLGSGQLFRYICGSDGFYRVVAGNSIILLRQKGNAIEYECSNGFDVKGFLGLSHNYGGILASIAKDEKIAAAIKSHYGLRILGQGLWECTASFICSSFSNIPRIRQCIEKVSATFGSSIEFKGFSTFAFPQPRQVSSLQKLEECGLGYRAKYLFETAGIFCGSDGFSQGRLRKLGYAGAKEKLMELPGVGSKVADCILLFSCGFPESFPVDVWVGRAMLANYGRQIGKFAKGKKVNAKVISEFGRNYFGSYAGYAQQFLFCDARVNPQALSARYPLP